MLEVSYDTGDEPEDQPQRLSAYPNPFHSSTTLSFSSKESIQNAEIKIYNIKGQLVRELRFDASPLSRFHQISWDGTDKNGNMVSSGLYYYQVKIGDDIIGTSKCLLIRE